ALDAYCRPATCGGECRDPGGRREGGVRGVGTRACVMSPRNFYGRMIGLDEAKPFIEAHHYSGSVPTGPNIFFGAFLDGDLYAVAAYGSRANMNLEPWLAELTGLPVACGNLTILKRLCRKGEKDDALDQRSRSRGEIPMTQFLSFCHRALREFFGIRYIMAYSDPAAGHNGG